MLRKHGGDWLRLFGSFLGNGAANSRWEAVHPAGRALLRQHCDDVHACQSQVVQVLSSF